MLSSMSWRDYYASMGELSYYAGPRTQLQRRLTMLELVNQYGRLPETRYFVAHVVCPHRNGYQRSVIAEEIVAWIKDNIRYFREAGEQFQTPDQTVRSRIGDCDDLAILACALLIAAGIPCRFKWFGIPALHVGVEVYVNRNWKFYELTK